MTRMNEEGGGAGDRARFAWGRFAWDGGRVSLRTLNAIRWIAIAGQAVTLLTVEDLVGVDIPLLPALAVTALSLLINLYAVSRRRRRPFLSEFGAACFLACDTLQMTLLLMLTGGLENPFAVLVLAPPMVGASMLDGRYVVALTLTAVGGLTLLEWLALPLAWPARLGVNLPRLYVDGIWVALSISAVFITTYVYRVAQASRDLSAALIASQVALSRAQKASALGALAAAAAHELGSPLGTIAVVAKELSRDLPPDSPWLDDVRLLQSQTARCRDILTDLARRPDAQSGDALQSYAPLPFPQALDAIAAPHRRAGVAMDITVRDLPDPVAEPDGDRTSAADALAFQQLFRSPEMQHGLGNIIQNAMQFAAGRVSLVLDGGGPVPVLTVTDDGPGFPVLLLERLGEPYVSGRDGTGGDEAAGNMGLGLFIAQTLLERTGAVVSYANVRPAAASAQGGGKAAGPIGSGGGMQVIGAQVTVRWPQFRH